MLKRDDDYQGGVRAVEQRYGSLRAQHRTTTRATINIDSVLSLHAPRVFTFRGERFAIDALPWRVGIALEYLDKRVHELLDQPLQGAALRELEAALDDAYRLIWSVARPIAPFWRRGWLKRRRHPFDVATLAEYSQLVTFCFECQKQLPNLALDITLGSITTIAPTRRTTSPIVLRSLQSATRAGWWARSRAAFITSRSVFAGSMSRQRGRSSPSRTRRASRTQ